MTRLISVSSVTIVTVIDTGISQCQSDSRGGLSCCHQEHHQMLISCGYQGDVSIIIIISVVLTSHNRVTVIC